MLSHKNPHYCGLGFVNSDQILAVLLDLDHYAWIWAILLKFGPYCLDLGNLVEFGSEKALKEMKA